MSREQRLVVLNIILWLLVIASAFFYFRYYRLILAYLHVFISIIPAIVFFIVGTLMLNYNGARVRRTKQKDEYTNLVELNWGMALKHDLLTYFVPAIMLVIPLFLSDTPTLGDFLAAMMVFLTLSYLKLLYWHRL